MKILTTEVENELHMAVKVHAAKLGKPVKAYIRELIEADLKKIEENVETKETKR